MEYENLVNKALIGLRNEEVLKVRTESSALYAIQPVTINKAFLSLNVINDFDAYSRDRNSYKDYSTQMIHHTKIDDIEIIDVE